MQLDGAGCARFAIDRTAAEWAFETGAHLRIRVNGAVTDIGNKAAVGGVSREFYHRLAQHYANEKNWTLETAADYFAKRRGGQAGASSLGGADATMWTFEPRVAEAVFLEMLREAKVPVHTQERLATVKKTGARITELSTQSGKTFRAKMFIDATYEGDLLDQAGVSFHVGREANSVYGETLNGIRAQTPHHQLTVAVDPFMKPGDPASGLLPFIQPGDGGKPSDGDARVQTYNYRLCFTTEPFDEVRIDRVLGEQHLDGHRTVEQQVAREVHVGHAAAPDALLEFVAVVQNPPLDVAAHTYLSGRNRHERIPRSHESVGSAGLRVSRAMRVSPRC